MHQNTKKHRRNAAPIPPHKPENIKYDHENFSRKSQNRPEEKPKWHNAPILNMQDERESSILNDTPALFEIKINKQAQASRLHEWKDLHLAGKFAVKNNIELVTKVSKKHNIDPNMVKAIIYAENASGHYGGFGYVADYLKVSKSQFPMNIQGKQWSRLIDEHKKDLYDSNDNIEAGVKLLKAIEARIQNPTPAKIASIWNFMGRETTNEFGHYVERIYDEKRWEK